MDINTKASWNVLSNEEFTERLVDVFNTISSLLTKTLGPYGHTTIIEQYGDMFVTKDGWQVIKSLRSSNMVENNILSLLKRISLQVVNMVGDGSSSAIVSANRLLEALTPLTKDKSVRPKDIVDNISIIVDKLCVDILTNSTPVSNDDIRRIAYISTNGNDVISDYIQQIYDETSNPSIDFVASKTTATKIEVVNGYKLKNCTYIDQIFINDKDSFLCHVDKPIIVVFDHYARLEYEYKLIMGLVNKFPGRRVVVVAKGYDKHILNRFQHQINLEFAQFGTSSIVAIQYSDNSRIADDCLKDFAIMCGAKIITDSDITQNYDMFTEFGDDYTRYVDYVSDLYGEVEEIDVMQEDTLVKGFIKRSDDEYNIALQDATVKYQRHFQLCAEKNIYDIELNILKSRLSRLNSSIGIIHVGGGTSLEKNANLDLVEDAVKACESAYYNGYNIGGNLAITRACVSLLNNDDTLTDVQRAITEYIKTAFINVFTTVLKNKDADRDYTDIIDKCITEGKCFNIVTEEYSDDIINSCMTDVQILKAASNIVSLMLSSNQYITIDVPKKA